MRLLFAHDHRFLRGNNGELFTPGHLPASTWDRFLEEFDDVHVLARDGGRLPDGARFARADHAGVTFDFLPSLSSVRGLLLRPRELDRRMAAAVRDADAVVARLPSEIGLLAIKHARQLSKPYAVEVVGCAWDGCFHHGAVGARLYAPVAFLRTRRAIGAAPSVLYVTSSWLQRRYPTNGHSIAASNVSLEPIDALGIARRERRLAELARGKRPVLGTIASLRVKYKGLQTAFSALSRLRASGMDLTYRILGPGPAEPWISLARQLGVEDLVTFDGTRSAGQSVYEWLDGIDIYLQPSFTEALPRALVEAMSRGAASIGSTRGGIPELLPSERLHVPGDIDRLADLIRQLVENPAAIAAVSRADRETAKQFDPRTLMQRRRQFYRRLKEEAEEQRSSRPVSPNSVEE